MKFNPKILLPALFIVVSGLVQAGISGFEVKEISGFEQEKGIKNNLKDLLRRYDEHISLSIYTSAVKKMTETIYKSDFEQFTNENLWIAFDSNINIQSFTERYKRDVNYDNEGLLQSINLILKKAKEVAKSHNVKINSSFFGKAFNIGTFSEPQDIDDEILPNKELLVDNDENTATSLRVIETLGSASDKEAFSFHSSNQAINIDDCRDLIAYMESAWKNTSQTQVDFQLLLTEKELNEIISPESIKKLGDLMDGDFNKIYLRRTHPSNKIINFHTDYSLKTLRVVLNEDYEGGLLIFATNKGFLTPPARIGYADTHNHTIPHGVTKIESGVRYALFFLREPESKVKD